MALAIALGAIVVALVLLVLLAALGVRHLRRVDKASNLEIRLRDATSAAESNAATAVDLEAQLERERERFEAQLEELQRRAASADGVRRELGEALEAGDPDRVAAIHDRLGDGLSALLSDATGSAGDSRASGSGSAVKSTASETSGSDRVSDSG